MAGFQGLLKHVGDTRSMDDINRLIVGKHPIELEERIGSLDRPLIIEVATPGWQPRMWPSEDAYPTKLPVNYVPAGVRLPAVPVSVDEQVEDIISAVRAGCQATHLHPRDPEDGMATDDPTLVREVYDRVLEQVDCIAVQHTWQVAPDGRMDYVSGTRELLELGGGTNRYCQGAVVLWPGKDGYQPDYDKSVRAGVEFMQENSIRPFHKIRGTFHARKLERDLIETSVLTQKPFVLIHDMGHPFGWPMDIDPWWPIEMVTNLEITKARFGDDVVLGVYSGGRNWLPVTLLAVMTGIDIVRLGIEDMYWMYPHRDDVIQRNIDIVNKVVDFCKIVGRPLATTSQARAILGIEAT